MCGIWALIKQNLTIDSKVIESFNSIKNRGPDTSVLHLNQQHNYITGFHRLAINDISVNGNQPFYHSTDVADYILMANGEIYNHKELEEKYDIKTKSKSDCAVLLPMFLKMEDEFDTFNNLLRGEYAILIIKKYKKTNFIEYMISTDPLSVRPMFYFVHKDIIGFSSLLSGLSNYSDNVQRLDQGTCIRGITDLEFFNEYDMVRYHTTPIDLLPYKVTDEEKDLIPLYQKIVDTLYESVKIRLESDRPLGCLLSGGLDSSLVSAIAAKELAKTGQKLRTFSIGMKDGTDIEYANMVAKHIDSDHTVFDMTQKQGLEVIENVIKATETYDITTIRASVGQYLIAKNISEKTNVKVILNGDGADECEMGYLYFYLHPSSEAATNERNKLLQQIHLFDGLRVDRNISYHGLEARVPFLDKEFVDLYYKISPDLLVPTKERMEKYLIRRAFDVIMPDLLPKEVMWRKKEAFSDGISSKEKSWYLTVKEHYDKLITDEEFTTKDELSGITPLCKESFYYRKRFNELFNKNERVIPRYWLANWSDSKDPSARTLKVYEDK